MLKKIGSTAAVIALGLSALTGCSSGKLTTEETCGWLLDQAKEQALAEKTEAAMQDMLSGDEEGFKSAMEEINAYMQVAADKTDDEKLAEALQVSADQNKQMIEVMVDEDLTLMEKSSKVQAMGTTAESEKMAYVDTACPNLQELGQ